MTIPEYSSRVRQLIEALGQDVFERETGVDPHRRQQASDRPPASRWAYLDRLRRVLGMDAMPRATPDRLPRRSR